MKKLAIITALLIALTVPVMAQTTKLVESGTSLIAMGSVYSNDKLVSFSGGFKIGTVLPLDKDKGLFLRTVYSRLNFGKDQSMGSIEVTGLMDWYIGKKWKLYALLGGNSYVTGENNGVDLIGGIGTSRRVWTEIVTQGIPASVDLYGEISLTDATGQVTGNFCQVNLGIKFNKGT